MFTARNLCCFCVALFLQSAAAFVGLPLQQLSSSRQQAYQSAAKSAISMSVAEPTARPSFRDQETRKSRVGAITSHAEFLEAMAKSSDRPVVIKVSQAADVQRMLYCTQMATQLLAADFPRVRMLLQHATLVTPAPSMCAVCG